MGTTGHSEKQITGHVLLVEPVRFGYNEQTAGTNAFQEAPDGTSPDEIQARAAAEFHAMVRTLRDRGIRVYVFEDIREPHTPDSIYPNNWISFHADGSVVVYPLLAPNRRLERRPEIYRALAEQHGFRIGEVVDFFTENEARALALEGTGSLVLDRRSRIAYACLSPRTHPEALTRFGEERGYRIVPFRACDGGGTEVYHTNVVMGVGEEFAVLCTEAVPDEDERREVVHHLESSGHAVIPITLDQMSRFAGNLLQVENAAGERFIVISSQAARSLRPDQLAALERNGTILDVPLDTIERYGGGSARCMLAEVFLPRAG